MGLNSFWSFSWRYSLVYWLIVKIVSSRFDPSPSVEITASTWSKPHYCVPNFFFRVLSRETNPSKRKYIKDELVLFPALPRNLNFVSFDVFKSQHFSTTSKKCAQEIICSLTWRKKTWFQLISLFEGAYVFVIEEREGIDCWSWWKWGRNSIRKTNCKLEPLRKLGNYISIGN